MYTLKEIAERWHKIKTENDILRMAVKNDVVLSAWYRGWLNIHYAACSGEEETYFSHREWHNGPFDINAHRIAELLANHKGAECSGFEHDGVDAYFATESNSLYIDLAESYPYATFHLTRDKIVVTSKNAEATEANFPDLVAGVTDNLQKDLLPSESKESQFLDPDHPWHSELLALAVKAWIELYSKREGNSSDNTHKPPGGHIAMIEKWLKDKDSSLLTKTSREYLGKVINPSKGGGPNKSQE